MNAITRNLINRVFPIMKRHNPKEILGTAFTIREKEKEFLITAYHVAEHAIEKNTNEVSLIIGKGKETLGTRIYEKIIHIDEEQDIIILETPKWMHRDQLPLTSTPEMALGQEVMWMGYPKGFSGGLWLPDTKSPIGIAGKGVIGALKPPPKIQNNGFLIEGGMNPGYSGGPVVYNPSGQTYVIGVISKTLAPESNWSLIIAGELGVIMKKVHEKLSH